LFKKNRPTMAGMNITIILNKSADKSKDSFCVSVVENKKMIKASSDPIPFRVNGNSLPKTKKGI
jgi:hypothetical protein